MINQMCKTNLWGQGWVKKPVFDCQGKNGVMSQAAAVLNDVAVVHIPKQEGRSAALGSGG